MTSKANVSDSEKSVEHKSVENIETTEENMDSVSAQSNITQAKHVYKRKKRGSNCNGNSGTTDISTDILAAIQELSIKHDETFCKISVIEFTTATVSQHIEKLSSYSRTTCGW